MGGQLDVVPVCWSRPATGGRGEVTVPQSGADKDAQTGTDHDDGHEDIESLPRPRSREDRHHQPGTKTERSEPKDTGHHCSATEPPLVPGPGVGYRTEQQHRVEVDGRVQPSEHQTRLPQRPMTSRWPHRPCGPPRGARRGVRRGRRSRTRRRNRRPGLPIKATGGRTARRWHPRRLPR